MHRGITLDWTNRDSGISFLTVQKGEDSESKEIRWLFSWINRYDNTIISSRGFISDLKMITSLKSDGKRKFVSTVTSSDSSTETISWPDIKPWNYKAKNSIQIQISIRMCTPSYEFFEICETPLFTYATVRTIFHKII